MKKDLPFLKLGIYPFPKRVKITEKSIFNHLYQIRIMYQPIPLSD